MVLGFDNVHVYSIFITAKFCVKFEDTSFAVTRPNFTDLVHAENGIAKH